MYFITIWNDRNDLFFDILNPLSWLFFSFSSSTDDVSILLHKIMEEARNLTKAERCSLFLVDHDAGELIAKVFDGIESEVKCLLLTLTPLSPCALFFDDRLFFWFLETFWLFSNVISDECLEHIEVHSIFLNKLYIFNVLHALLKQCYIIILFNIILVKCFPMFLFPFYKF